MTAKLLSPIDYTKKDYAALRDDLLALARERLPEWTDHSPNDMGVVLIELFAYLGDMLFYYQDRIAGESYLGTAVERRSIIDLLRLIGYELRPPQPASADLTMLFDAESGASSVDIRKGTIFSTTKESTGAVIKFQYVLDDFNINLVPLPRKSYKDQKIYRWYRKKLPVMQVDDYFEEVTIGSSDGGRKQRFCLPEKPVIDGQLEIQVNNKLWELKETLLYSLSCSQHYTIHRDQDDKTWVEFGDGEYGAIPSTGTDNIKATYRVGGGTKGNVPAHTITKWQGEISNLKFVFNEQAASAGTDAESSLEAVEKGPKLFRAMRRAVTIQDYEDYARQFGIGKVRARPGPWNVVELCVAPVGGGYPTDTLKSDLRAFFEDKRMVTYLVKVTDPVYIPVVVEGVLDVESFFFLDDIRQKVENAVNRLLAFDTVSFADKLYLSKVYEAVEAIEGVAGVTITCFERRAVSNSSSSPPVEENGVLNFGWNEIPTAAVATGIALIKVNGGRRD